MTFLFISNAFNHHQKPLCDALYKLVSGNFKFVATAKLSEERKSLGWGKIEKPEYLIELDQQDVASKEFISNLINESDVVILGRCPLAYHKIGRKKGKIIFLYSERKYKSAVSWVKILFDSIRTHLWYGESRKVNLLCASAYAALDYSKQLAFINRKYKWGYFPETRRYDNIEDLLQKKKIGLKRQGVSILWVARLIGWKHPEMPVLLAERLKSEGILFDLNMIGNGVLEDQVRKMIEEKGLNDCVHLLGSMEPESVRDYMEKSDIFLMTSDRNEGWGAVLNESMNSACAVVANKDIGAVPFLVQDGKNGLTYRDGDFAEFYKQVITLVRNHKLRENMGKNAYNTIINIWNAENAARKLIELCDGIISNQKVNIVSGPCSIATVIR